MKNILEDCIGQIDQAASRFPWTNRAAYADWLAQTYYYVRHSTRLLAAAAARFPQNEMGNALHHRFATHMGEEKKHELLASHDIKTLGTDITAIVERHSTRMFYESQYFKIEHLTPFALLGYIMPLEAASPVQGRRVFAVVSKAFGDKAASFLKVHVNEDEDHLEKALAIARVIPPAEREVVEQTVRQTTFGYIAILEDIERSVAA